MTLTVIIVIIYLLKMLQKAEKMITGIKRKTLLRDDKRKKSPQKKMQKIYDFCERNIHDISPSPERNEQTKNSDKDDNKNSNIKTEVPSKNAIKDTIVETTSNQCDHSSVKCNVVENISTFNAEKIIMDLFLVEMPIDFFQFYDFCKSISKDNPLLACKSVSLKLVGPYNVLDGKIESSDVSDKEKYLRHWRYYYDPPEFQVCRMNDICF